MKAIYITKVNGQCVTDTSSIRVYSLVEALRDLAWACYDQHDHSDDDGESGSQEVLYRYAKSCVVSGEAQIISVDLPERGDNWDGSMHVRNVEINLDDLSETIETEVNLFM